MNLAIRITCVSTLVITAIATAGAQTQSADRDLKNEVGLVIGAAVTPSVGLARGGSLSFNPGLTLGAEYDHRLLSRRKLAFYGGVDFFVTPLDVKLSSPPADVSPQYAALFFTPHLRVKLYPDAKFQPWLEFGGGYANFAPSQPLASSVKVTGSGSTGTFEFGGGLDTKPVLHLRHIPIIGEIPVGARVEVHDFYSGQPNYGVPITSGLQNNVVLTGGLLLRF